MSGCKRRKRTLRKDRERERGCGEGRGGEGGGCGLAEDTRLSQLSPAERLQSKNYIRLSCFSPPEGSPRAALTTETRNRLTYLKQHKC